MAKNFYGSIDLTKLLEAAKKQHSGFAKSQKNNHIYVSVTVWENDEPDKFGHVMAIKVNRAKDATDDPFYIGNLKPGDDKAPQILSPEDAAAIPAEDDLPF